MNIKLEEALRDICQPTDWTPTQQQLSDIKREIVSSISAGITLNRTKCGNIVVKHCGSVTLYLTKGIDNSDLNTLLMLAIKKDSA